MPTKRFANLSAAQQRVFEQIAVNNDGGHHPATLKALERKGMIESYLQRWSDVFPGGITRYRCVIAWHIAWCEWCADQPDEDTPPSTDTPTRPPGSVRTQP